MTTTAEKVSSTENVAVADAAVDAAAEKPAMVQATGDKSATAAAASGTGAAGAVSEKAEKPVPRRALGRGLESLLPGGTRMVPGGGAANPRTLPGSMVSQTPGSGGGGTVIAAINHSTILSELHAQALKQADGHAVLDLAIEQIDPNPYQTRNSVSRQELQELAESIKSNGVIQPIVVRPGKDGRYFLITGSRRTQAARMTGLAKVPAIVRHVSEQQAAEMTIVENLQREDLNCYEQANAFARLSQQFKLTQEEIGQRVGIDRSTVSNYMRLLKLPDEVQHMLRDGWLDFSQARCLLTLAFPEHIIKLAKEAVEKHLSLDQLETLVIRANYPVEGQEMPEKTGRHAARWVDPNVKAAQRDLERILGVRVKIRDRRGKGKIVIEYSTLEDFDRVLEMLKGKEK